MSIDELVYKISQATEPVINSLSLAKNELETTKKLGNVMDKYMPEFSAMANAVVAAIGDGFQFSDLSAFSKIIVRVMEIANEIGGMTGEEKRDFVVDVIWLLYHEIDTGPDGSANRIMVPGLNWLSAVGITSTEEAVERYVLGMSTRFAIDTVYPFFKKYNDEEDTEGAEDKDEVIEKEDADDTVEEVPTKYTAKIAVF